MIHDLTKQFLKFHKSQQNKHAVFLRLLFTVKLFTGITKPSEIIGPKYFFCRLFLFSCFHAVKKLSRRLPRSGPPQPIFGRRGLHTSQCSGSHICSMQLMPPPLSILQNPCKCLGLGEPCQPWPGGPVDTN